MSKSNHVHGSNYWADYSKLSQTVSTTCQPLVRLLPEAWENTQAVAWHELVNLTPLEVCTPEVEEDRRWALRHDRLAFAGSGRSVEIHCSVRHWQTASPLHRRQHTLSPTRSPVCLYITLQYRAVMLLTAHCWGIQLCNDRKPHNTTVLLDSISGNIRSYSWPNHSSDVAKWSLSHTELTVKLAKFSCKLTKLNAANTEPKTYQ